MGGGGGWGVELQPHQLPVGEVLQQAPPQLFHHHPSSSSSAVRSARKKMRVSSGDGNTPVRGGEDMKEGGREEGGRGRSAHPFVHLPIFLMVREIGLQLCVFPSPFTGLSHHLLQRGSDIAGVKECKCRTLD